MKETAARALGTRKPGKIRGRPAEFFFNPPPPPAARYSQDLYKMLLQSAWRVALLRDPMARP